MLAVAQAAIDRVRLRTNAQNLWVTLMTDAPGCQLDIEDDAQALDLDEGWQTELAPLAQRIGARVVVSHRQPTGHRVRLTVPGSR